MNSLRSWPKTSGLSALFPRVPFFAAVSGAVVVDTTFFLFLGFRPDIAQAMESVRFLFKFVITLTLAVAATGVALHLARPGDVVAGWGWALAAVPLLLLCAALPARLWLHRLVGHNARFCLTLIPLFSIGPLICIFAALRRGAPTYPCLTGAVAGLAASGIGATFYAANCNDDGPLFVATWYPLATSVVVIIAFLRAVNCCDGSAEPSRSDDSTKRAGEKLWRRPVSRRAQTELAELSAANRRSRRSRLHRGRHAHILHARAGHSGDQPRAALERHIVP